MADKKLSSVSAVSDMNYVYAETSSGETVKISKADLASVLADAMGSSKFLRVDNKTGAAGQSSISKTGAFFISGTSTSDPIYDSGILLNFAEGSNVLQFKMCLNTKKILYRAGTSGSLGSWSTVF